MMDSSRELQSPSQEDEVEEPKAAVMVRDHEEKKEDGHLLAQEEVVEEKELVAQAMTLNVAYESLELVRKLNLQAEFGESVDVTECTQCLEEQGATTTTTRQRRAVPQWMARKRFPCLTCGSQVCHKHRSTSFNKQNIAVSFWLAAT
jgi:hypothetical protein